MAVNIAPNVVSVRRPIGPLGRLLQMLRYRTADWPLIPRGYAQIVCPANGSTRQLGQISGAWGAGIPDGVTTVVINVEGGSLRYCDSDVAGGTYGELYAAGSSFGRTLKDLGAISLAADAAGGVAVTANISFYATYG